MEEQLPGVEKDVLLAPYTTFGIGGPAKYFFRAKTKQDIVDGVQVAKASKMPFFVLAGGSNVLVSDAGFEGLVIFIENTKHEINETTVISDAGVTVSTLVEETGKRGLAGLEWAGGLPGTLGGAVRGNAGAFGGETKDIVVSVEAVNYEGEVRMFSNEECMFSYRSSIFKEEGWVVLSVTLDMKEGNASELQKIAAEHILYREERHPLEYPNAGSVFKNCDFANFPEEFKDQVKEKVKTDPFPVVPTAYIISEADLKGLRVGGAQVSEKHPNYIVNTGKATANDVLELISQVKERVKERFGVDLEQEIQYIY